MFGLGNKKSSNKPTEIKLSEDQWMFYNGCKIHWFIGDRLNSNDGMGGWPIEWHAWGAYYDESGKCYPYRLHACFNSKTRILSEICVNPKPTNAGSMIYWNEEVYNLLTK
jgi:hypothetical protein